MRLLAVAAALSLLAVIWLRRRGRRLSLQRLLTTLGGAHSEILADALPDVPEMMGRGIAALIPALFGSLAAAVAFHYAYSVPVGYAAAAGAGWGLVVLLFDLSLMSASSGKGWARRIVTYGSRALVSILAALTFAGPLVLWMYAKDIAVQTAADIQAELAAYNSRYIVPLYVPVINADKTRVAQLQQQEATAEESVAGLLRTVEVAETTVLCERGGISDVAGCPSGSGVPGDGDVYVVRVSQLHNDEANLAAARAKAKALRAQNDPQIGELQASVRTLQQKQQAAYAAARTRYAGDTGLIARWRALDKLEAAEPGVRLTVRLLEGLIIAVDLTAVIAKFSSKTPSYDRLLEASRKKVTLYAIDDEEEAEHQLERRRAGREAVTDVHQEWLNAQTMVAFEAISAWAEAARSRVREWLNEQTSSPDSAAAGRPRSQDTAYEDRPRAGREAPITGLGLASFTAISRSHESLPVNMAAPLRRLAWIGTALLVALAAALLLIRESHVSVTGIWLAVAAAAAALVLALYSRGFSRAPAWGHRAAYVVALLGPSLPVVIVLLNI